MFDTLVEALQRSSGLIGAVVAVGAVLVVISLVDRHHEKPSRPERTLADPGAEPPRPAADDRRSEF